MAYDFINNATNEGVTMVFHNNNNIPTQTAARSMNANDNNMAWVGRFTHMDWVRTAAMQADPNVPITTVVRANGGANATYDMQ